MTISQLFPHLPAHRKRIDAFLADRQLRYDHMDYYAVVTDGDDDERILAGGGLSGNVIKCVAVAEAAGGEHLCNTIVSHLLTVASEWGHHIVRVFTKPRNLGIFSSLSFRLLAESPEAILMETGIGGLSHYLEYLKTMRHTLHDGARVGAVVMNANPFTLGHRYLVEQAAADADWLYVIAVREDRSLFAYDERLRMIREGCEGLPNVTVCEGSDYAVSGTTFPTYFLKRLDDASDTQMTLDLDLFRRHIAKALGVTVRYVGSEDGDPLTQRYNELMARMLPEVRETRRLEMQGEAVSASKVRAAVANGRMSEAAMMTPRGTWPCLLSHLVTRALRMELDATPKPGLVDCHDSGAHRDMDHALMARSVMTLQPYFERLARIGMAVGTDDVEAVRAIGIEAEKAMLEATHGVNTHKGALFCMGLMTVAAAHALAMRGESLIADRKPATGGGMLDAACLQEGVSRLAAHFAHARDTHGHEVRQRDGGGRLSGAVEMARSGYARLFAEWLPYYRRCADSHPMQRTLLLIMSVLDDTNIAYRAGVEAMEGVKGEASVLLENFSVRGLEEMNADFVRRGISPGGSADMLALTVYADSLTR